MAPSSAMRASAANRRSQRTHRIGFWIVLAVLIHAELALVLGVIVYFTAPRDADIRAGLVARGLQQPESIDVGMIDEEQARKIIADLERAAEKAKQESIKKEVESTRAPGQVVDIPRPRNEQRPDSAKFASEYDSTVERETKKYGKLDEKAQQGDLRGDQDEARPSVDRPAVPQRPSALAMRMPGNISRAPGPDRAEWTSSAERSAATTEVSPDGSLAEPGTPAAQQSRGGGGGGVPLSALMPSERQLSRAIGGGTRDALKDVDEGDETALNSKKWRFASFFNRVKRQVQDHWHPDDAYRRRDPTGAVYGHRDRLTILRVQLKPDGSLANVALESPSGIDFLDDEAIEAFKQAQPFPNPPRQLVEDGAISFRFGFLLELSASTRTQLFRYNSM